MSTLTVDASNVVVLGGTRIGRIVAETGKPVTFQVDHPSFSTQFSAFSGHPIATITNDGRRAYAPRVAELLGLIDDLSTENANTLFSKA